MKKQVRGDDAFSEWISASEVDQCAKRWGGGQAAAWHDVPTVKWCAPDGCAWSAPAPERFRDRDLNRLARRHVETMQPRCGSAGERSAGWQSPRNRGELHQRALLQPGPAI